MDPRRAPDHVRGRSDVRIVRSSIDVKQWLHRGPPSVDVARPAHCPGCGTASRPLGDGLVLHGHGLRPRTVIVRSQGRSILQEIQARRYVCRACDAVALVMPADVARRCLYTLSVIAAALAAWSCADMPACSVRSAFSAFPVVGAAVTGWASLVRWSRAANRLWAQLGATIGGSPRSVAGRVAARLCAFAPVPSGHVPEDAAAGAVHAA